VRQPTAHNPLDFIKGKSQQNTNQQKQPSNWAEDPQRPTSYCM